MKKLGKADGTNDVGKLDRQADRHIEYMNLAHHVLGVPPKVQARNAAMRKLILWREEGAVGGIKVWVSDRRGRGVANCIHERFPATAGANPETGRVTDATNTGRL